MYLIIVLSFIDLSRLEYERNLPHSLTQHFARIILKNQV